MITSDTILQNRYRVLRPLGRGGMGAVYEAFDERLSRNVALKETIVETDNLKRAFEREARLLANLRHPALPKVLDHFSEAAGMFVVMEYIPGDDLGVMLEHGRVFVPAEVLRWADQLLDALEYLHRLDPPVLHRDIKPSNLKLISKSHIILLDFGLAKGSAGQMTRTGDVSVLGYSPNYAPLEQMQGTGTDERSDLYSLGATLYHLLTGVRPPDALTRATAVVNGQPDPLRPAHQINQQPTASSAALMRAMALNIDHRPRTASEMRDELHRIAPQAASTVAITDTDETTKISLPVDHAVVVAPDIDPNRQRGRQLIVPLPEETWVDRRPDRSGRKWLIGVALAVGLATLSAVLYLSNLGTGSSRRAPINRPMVEISPLPTPSPTPNANINEQADINGESEVSPNELAAREQLEQKNIPYSESAFTRVVEEGNTGAVDLFLAAGMNPNVPDSTGRTALINAAARGRNNISQKLLGKGADVNASDGTGATALIQSARNGHQETTKVLLENGADVNLTDANGQTALMRAAAQGHADIVRLLINEGARIDVKDRNGRNALAWAEINNKSEVINLLKRAGAAKP